jgi:hypothetical protein
MSHVPSYIKAILGGICLLLSVSVTFFDSRPTISSGPVMAGFSTEPSVSVGPVGSESRSSGRRSFDQNDEPPPNLALATTGDVTEATSELSLLMLEAEALRNDLETQSVSSPAE